MRVLREMLDARRQQRKKTFSVPYRPTTPSLHSPEERRRLSIGPDRAACNIGAGTPTYSQTKRGQCWAFRGKNVVFTREIFCVRVARVSTVQLIHS